MEEAPKFNFFSFTFLVGFGLGGFIGVLLGLLAFGLVKSERNDSQPNTSAQVQPTVTLAPGVTATPQPKPKTREALDVRLGPGTAFAVVGTIPRGGDVEPVGRDNDSQWLAIRFPPGSTARGWVQVSDVDNLTDVDRLAVVAPTPIPNSISTATASSGSSSSGSTASRAPLGEDAPARSIATAIATPFRGTITPTPSFGGLTTVFPTPTPRTNTGPTDLVVSRVSLLPDGRVAVTVGNRGPGDLVGKAIFVSVRDLTLRGEQLSTQVATLPVGGTITLTSTTFRVDRETDVQAIVDPFGNVNDPDRSNNQTNVTLAPAPGSVTTP